LTSTSSFSSPEEQKKYYWTEILNQIRQINITGMLFQ
jgi:hypothetical protein